MLLTTIVWDEVRIEHNDPNRPDKTLQNCTVHVKDGCVTIAKRRPGGGFFDNAGTYLFHKLTELTPWGLKLVVEGVEDRPTLTTAAYQATITCKF